MNEISLNVLDIAENSVRAQAKLIEIYVAINTSADTLTITVKDNGTGMDEATLAKVCDPFFTSRTTRGVGLGVSFFKAAAELTGGSFYIKSTLGVGTETSATFVLSSIDRMPLGNISETIFTLAVFNETGAEFLYEYEADGTKFSLDTREFKAVLETDTLNIPDVSAYVKEYLTENTEEVNEKIRGLVL
ncbi:MAG: ATP-binding protein [Oscillospiraceae bacterium]|jgi:hypothetical protein|nr:ATP-binding protein [Oscillospiraceae bacterium]